MEVTESLARAVLDTLPSQIAVLDDEGNILFTNSSWGEIEDGAGDEDSEATINGVNYMASIDPTEDEHAAQAAEGLGAVLSGDRAEFRLEYPCHTPEENRWFMMRARSFPLGRRRFTVIIHIDITERRLAEMEARENAERAERERRTLEHLIERMNGLVQDITRLLVESVSRAEIEAGVCERLAGTDPYVFAWVGDADLSGRQLEPREMAGSADVAVQGVDRPLTDDTDDPSVRALREESIQIVHADGTDDLPDGVETVVAVPLVTRDATYGVLTVYSGERDAFDEREQVVLEALGRAIANAISALESRRTLTSNSVVELEFTVEDDDLFPCRLSAATGCTLSYSGSVPGPAGSLQLFYTVTGAEPDRVRDVAAADAAVEGVRQLTDREEGSLFQFALRDSLVATLLDRGAVTQAIVGEDGVSRLTVEIPREADARELFESVTEAYDGTELVGYHEYERPVQTRQEFRADLEERLTDRQLTALRTAYHSGFFDWPRNVDGDELAEMMDISRSTFHQHLRVAERKVLDGFFEHR